MIKRGIFITIEGGDGSGKRTQAELLQKHCSEKLGKHAVLVSFPRYGEASGYFAGRYLDGAYGAANDVHPELASLPYAIDRFAARDEILAALNEPNSIVIADRYVASNMAHQGTKIADASERKEFYERIMQTEYDILGIPRPDKNIVLLVPAETAQANVDKKAPRLYTQKKRDIHEADASHLEKAKANYEELCDLYPDEFTPIKCTDDEKRMRTIEEIQIEIQTILAIDNIDKL
jgi:dTMP kinase